MAFQIKCHFNCQNDARNCQKSFGEDAIQNTDHENYIKLYDGSGFIYLLQIQKEYLQEV